MRNVNSAAKETFFRTIGLIDKTSQKVFEDNGWLPIVFDNFAHRGFSVTQAKEDGDTCIITLASNEVCKKETTELTLHIKEYEGITLVTGRTNPKETKDFCSVLDLIKRNADFVKNCAVASCSL